MLPPLLMKGDLPSQGSSVDASIALEKEVAQASWSSVQDPDAEAMRVASLLQSALTASREVLAMRYSTAENTRNTFTFLEFHKPDSRF